MKICDLTQFYSPVSGGVKRYIQEKKEYLREYAPEEKHILIVPGERDEAVEENRCKVYTISSPLVSRTSRYRMLLRLEAVEEILESERPDIIESGDPYQIAWKAIASGRGLGIPVVGFYHSHFPEAYLRSAAKFFGQTAMEFTMDLARRYVCLLYNKFERTFVPSPVLGGLLKNWGVENVENIDLGVNTDVFRPAPRNGMREHLGIPPDRILLLYVGRLAHEKNTRTLFDAFSLLSQKDPGRFHLLAVGDGNQRNLLKDLQSQNAAVSWLPYCGDSNELADLYRAADLFVHPGIQETFGLVTLESQACGTPVVGIRGSYMDRIIQNDQTLWAPHNTPEALAHAIQETGKCDLPTLGKIASERVLKQYSWKIVFDRLFGIYRDVIRGYKKP